MLDEKIKILLTKKNREDKNIGFLLFKYIMLFEIIVNVISYWDNLTVINFGI